MEYDKFYDYNCSSNSLILYLFNIQSNNIITYGTIISPAWYWSIDTKLGREVTNTVYMTIYVRLLSSLTRIVVMERDHARHYLLKKKKKTTKKLFIWLYEHFNRLIIVCTGSHAYSSNKSMLCHTKSLEVFFSKLSPNDLPNSLSSYFSAMGLALCVGDLGAPRCDDSGMKIATNNASMTNIAPNAKGGPGIIVWNEKLNIL